ncbi:malonic semialdehyde reductase [Novosphingobium sp. B 225]|uniref:malonic semialdehyde reductase n=1 Tax=Novosphingobium sp. B 225 TaxID=1961849 RepID=UPI000B4BEA88|nr:malonic semialdehyde reductase [Novosphingobium sp. B 225]
MDDALIRKMFLEARSQNGWIERDVAPEKLVEAHDIAKLAPTSVNGQPMRLVVLRSKAARERLRPSLPPSNYAKLLDAPLALIVAYDVHFYDRLEALFPHNLSVGKLFEGDRLAAEETAFRNGSMQAAYYIMALRAVGLDVAPISGFDKKKVQEEFFGGTTCEVNFLCGVGHGDPEMLFDRLPRLNFEEISSVI